MTAKPLYLKQLNNSRKQATNKSYVFFKFTVEPQVSNFLMAHYREFSTMRLWSLRVIMLYKCAYDYDYENLGNNNNQIVNNK